MLVDNVVSCNSEFQMLKECWVVSIFRSAYRFQQVWPERAQGGFSFCRWALHCLLPERDQWPVVWIWWPVCHRGAWDGCAECRSVRPVLQVRGRIGGTWPIRAFMVVNVSRNKKGIGWERVWFPGEVNGKLGEVPLKKLNSPFWKWLLWKWLSMMVIHDGYPWWQGSFGMVSTLRRSPESKK